MNYTISLVKELLEVPAGYQVIFLGGGASLQFAMVPMNMMNTRSDLIPGMGNQGPERSKTLSARLLKVASSKTRTLVTYPRTIMYPLMLIIFT